jgi:heterodisulfide reductase subunit A-like polyferredoxin
MDGFRHMGSMNGEPTGAVMVVGGGIAGMQASLDLADQGFKVYLVESQSAIGGKMAQLDKTFPTNDCAMCTISPKLVETGRHPNIELLTDSEVLDIVGEVGNYTVEVKHHPRYIDTDVCIACGDCATVCPIVIPDEFNEGLAHRRAAFKLYPQAVPNAFAIEKLGVAPCRDACPAGQRAQGYIALIGEGRYDDAMRVIKLDNPFPGICGRICNHRCEIACTRGRVDEPINIRALKRFVTDKVYAEPRRPVEPVPRIHDESIAIIGAGPCGLTAAQDLAMAGYAVTVYESMPVAGGMLRLGVPEFRLPSEVVEREVRDIVDLGVRLELNHTVDNLDDLFEAGHDAILIAVGAHEGIRLPIPGADLPGVLINTRFLRDMRLGHYDDEADADVPPLGEKVLVLGGGNVAIDVARSAVRLGRDVHMACLEGRDEMPAHPWEIEAAEAEGITVHPGRTFEQILSDDEGNVTAVECRRVASFSFGDDGRLSVTTVDDSLHVLECDTVIFSVGQRAGLAFIPDDAGVGVTRQNTISIDPHTLAASRPGVFAAGDSVSGTSFVIEAVDSGHKAAASLIRYLQGEDLEPPPPPEVPVARPTDEELARRVASGRIERRPRVPLPELPVLERIHSFAEIERGYDDESARAEASRCLACGVCSECMSCAFACGVNAVDHDMIATVSEIDVGAVILAPGYQIYKAELAEEYGLGRYPNVITALQFERLLSASGPTTGHVVRPSDHEKPKRVAFLQCIGSRDQTRDYCSAVCCMYATKEAIMAKEHEPDLDIQVFMMDMRAFSKGYWSYFERARDRYGVEYTRCRISGLREDPATKDLLVRYNDEAGRLHEEPFDLVVLSVGMEISDSVKELGTRLGIELDEYGFCHTAQFNPLESSKPGIYAVGPFREPKDIPESVIEASGAAAAAATRLGESRFSLTTDPSFPDERDITDEALRIGVFVCHCGSNIGGYLDVPDVAEYAGDLPGVAYAEANLYTCSQDSVKHIAEQVQEQQLNRVVVASCTPLTHGPLFRDMLRSAGLNPYLFEMANIRNQCSWVHSDDNEAATAKARDLVRMAVARAALLEPQHTFEVPVTKRALVVGGGVAGMTAAASLADQGYPVDLVEREETLGGNLGRVRMPFQGKQPQHLLAELSGRVERNPLVDIHLGSRVVGSSGFMGNFTSTVEKADGARVSIDHGVTILATGGREYRGPEYGYGTDPRIVTQQEFEQRLEAGDVPDSVVMIQCVGPAEQYCSRICCTIALKNALALKERKPDAQVVVLYRDIRVYGFKERSYTEARSKGVLFVHYDPDEKPVVEANGSLQVRARDPILDRAMELEPDLVVLSMPVVPRDDSDELANFFKCSIDADGFFLEAHVKLRPVDFSSAGVFMAGMAHYPKLSDETMIQAQAAAARAARVLSKDTLLAGGQVAVVDHELCTGCLTCVRVCPFGVPRIDASQPGIGGILGAATIEAAICRGCGVCVAECPGHAIQLMHYTDSQATAKVAALVGHAPEGFIPLDSIGAPSR